MAEMIMGTEIRDPSLEGRIIKSEMIIEIPEIRAPSLESLSNLGEELEKESLAAPYAGKEIEELEEEKQKFYAIENPYKEKALEELEEKREGVYGEIPIPLLKSPLERESGFESRVAVVNNPLSHGLPKDAKVWIYFITSHVLKDIYEHLTGALSNLGIYTKDVNVIILRREEYEEEIERLKREIGFKRLPCLIITYEPLFDEVLKGKKEKKKVYALKHGIFTKQLIEDNKRVKHFVEGLYNAAKEGNLKGYLRSEEVKSLLGMAWNRIKDFVRIIKVSEVEP